MGADEETERIVKANDRIANSRFKYANNYIKTSKYNIFTFLPINLFEQFLRIANFYFLVLFILQLIGPISSLSPVTTALPLVVVLGLTAIKDAVDDFRRHKSDNQVNNRESFILVNGELTTVKWQHVQVGDIIRMKNNDFIAADILLLSSSEPHSLVYVETAELDGETNLKVRQALPETSKLGEDLERLSGFQGEIRCEAPNNVLDKFDGAMSWAGDRFSLNNDQIMLRGCRLRNTAWCYGIVIFAGKDTKLMQNSGKSKFKRTSLDRLLNKMVIFIFGFLFTMCVICAILCSVWELRTGSEFQAYLPWEYQNAATISTLTFFSYVILLNTVVPISLYVTVEMIRLCQSLLINWDVKMYYDPKETGARARSTTLNEELGQIQYVFSDKTGTLTQNMMTFNKASIGGRKFGEVKDINGDVMDITEDTPLVDFSSNTMCEPGFKFYDPSLLDSVQRGDKHCWLFFRLLSLCHTVMPETDADGNLAYQAQSPDEAALVGAARNFGFVFKSRTPTTITLVVQGQEDVYELLHILDFNNVRKRMSVIVKQGQKIKLFCKGADTVIYERLGSSSDALKDVTTEHLNDFANDGLRTLCLAMKEVDEHTYYEWRKRHQEASLATVDRESKLDEVYNEIEQDLVLLGATAIEDKLQDGVPQTIQNLHKANIKLWVLTGDKQETAINIGYSCNLLTEDLNEIFIISAKEKVEAREELEGALCKIKDVMGIKDKDQLDDDVSYQSKDIDELGDIYSFAIVVTGAALAHLLDPEVELDFLEAACYCKTVICCRVTPLQKAQVVDLVKTHRNAVTLAIGDGANDVSMIKTAHIGVGISGQEGMQAVLSSDFSFAQFRYLERLLLVHGRWSYYRMCKFLSYFFYKNFAFTVCHFWFAFFCGYSAMTGYDQWFITAYNTIFTSTPVISLGIFDQDVNDEMSIRFPALYKPGQKNKFFNWFVFLKSLFQGVITSLALFFIPYGALSENLSPDGQPIHTQFLFGAIVATMLVHVVNLKIAIDTSYWTVFSHLCIWGSIALYWLYALLLYSEPIYELLRATFTYVGVTFVMCRLPTFWFTIALLPVILLFPALGRRSLGMDVAPTLTDRVRLLQRKEAREAKKAKGKGDVELTKIRNKSAIPSRIGSARPGSRMGSGKSRPGSVRSGYAFAHQEGFGEMITSGRSMRIKDPPEKNGTTGGVKKTKSKENVEEKKENGVTTVTDEEINEILA
ncbi:probable phospholipid-transporting ATPase IM [Lytechinus variegatus]|uniref:probable phospholipid-transporting ATPase IM n=1 Tax=Lytechinus variegatus TaxID=7654 RepID=UPI001BB242D6|nr:probable phospholipid-transporting ATPase IM [Lytechinus variegatus]